MVRTLLVLASLLSAPAVWATERVMVDDRTGCLAGSDTAGRLGAVIDAGDPEALLSVAVVVAPAVDGSLATMRVLVNHSGELVLERTFTLAPVDCPSAPDLLGIVLERFLAEAPLERWRPPKPPAPPPPPEPPPPETILVTRDVASMAGHVFLAADGRLPEASADLELGAAIDVGSANHRLVASLALRVGLPDRLGQGRYLESLGLLGVGWRWADRGWMVRAEARTGGLLVSGFGYDRSFDTWLLWLEAQVAVLYDLDGILLGAQVAGSPLWHEVATTSGESRRLPWLRLGLTVGFPFWYSRF